MEIRVEVVADEPRPRVAFTCPLGAAWGVWRGREAPCLGSYTVEFDIPGDFGVWSEVEGPPAIAGELQRGQIAIRAQLESVDEDGVAGIRLGTDVVLVDMPPGVENFPVGTIVEFAVDQIDIYPYIV